MDVELELHVLIHARNVRLESPLAVKTGIKMTFKEWFADYPGKDEPGAERLCYDAWRAAKFAGEEDLDPPYVDSRIEEMNHRTFGKR